MFFVDFCLKFFQAYTDTHAGQTHTSPRDTALRYVRRWGPVPLAHAGNETCYRIIVPHGFVLCRAGPRSRGIWVDVLSFLPFDLIICGALNGKVSEAALMGVSWFKWTRLVGRAVTWQLC